MNVTVEKLPKCLTEVSATFPAEMVSSEKLTILNSFSTQANIPGFRPGKAPKRVIEKRYGKEIEGELENNLIGKVMQHAYKEEKIDFLSINKTDFMHQPDGSAKAVISLIVSPEFELGEYKGISITVPEMEVTDEVVESEILQMRQQQAEYPVKEEGAVEEGDVAVISYSAKLNGGDPSETVAVDIAPYDKKDDYWIKAGEDHFLPGFSQELINGVVGSEQKIDHTFSDEFAIEELRGKTFNYTVEIKEIKEEKLPEEEDMVKKMMGEEADLDAFRARVKEYITQQQEKSLHDMKVGKILEQVTEGIEFDLPEEILNSETQSQADRLVSQGVNYGLGEEDVVKMEDSIIQTAEKQASDSLRNHFILQKIAEVEGIKVEEQEVQQKLFMDAYQRGEDPQKALKEAKKSGGDYNVRQSILMDKVVDFLVNEADITTEKAE